MQGQAGEFNSLGQLLADGAEQAVALALYHNYPPDRVSSIISRRFGPLADSDRASLEGLARDGVAAGSRITDKLRGRAGSSGAAPFVSLPEGAESPPGERILPSELPTNPYLYGDDREGRRSRFIGVVEFPESGAIIRIYIDFEDVPSVDEMIAAFEQKGAGIGERYPTKFGLDPNAGVQTRVLDIAFAEKAF